MARTQGSQPCNRGSIPRGAAMELSKEYIAGFFDGEGSVFTGKYISGKDKKKRVRLTAKLYQNVKPQKIPA